MAYENILVETRGKVGLITLNRPQAMNALSPALMRELGAALSAFEADEAIGAMVLTGSDKAFAAGADIKAMKDWGYMDVYKSDYITAEWETLARCRKPVIAAVHGVCIGGGVDVITACDVRVATADARFSVREVRVAMVADLGTLQRLSRIVGEGHARELAMTGLRHRAIEVTAAWRRRIISCSFVRASARPPAASGPSSPIIAARSRP